MTNNSILNEDVMALLCVVRRLGGGVKWKPKGPEVGHVFFVHSLVIVYH